MDLKRSGYIDQWRGISVLMVIVHHALGRFEIAWKHAWPLKVWGVHAGLVGVCVFFVISGYLITALMLREEQRTGTISLTAFYVRRAFRIFPAMLLFIGIVVALDAIGAIRMQPGEALTAATFTCNTAWVACGYHFGHFWSLAVEEQFYLVWPFILLAAGRWRVPLVTALFVTALIASAMPGLLVRGWLNNGLAVSCLSAGVLFALSPKARAGFTRIQQVPPQLLFVILCLVVPFALTTWSAGHYPIVVLLPFLIVATVLGRQGSVFASTGGLLEQVGLVSYSLYLWHAIAVWDADKYLQSWFVWVSVLAFPIAWMSYHFIEMRFVALGRRATARYSQPARQALNAVNDTGH